MLVHEEKIEKPYLPDFMYIARSGLNILAVCLNDTIALYKIEATTGKLIHFFTERADFAAKDSCLNCCCLALDNSILATGGADCVTRLFYLQKDFKGVDRQQETNGVVELSGPSVPVTGVDFSHDNKLVLVLSKDKQTHIFDVAKRQVLQKLTFMSAAKDGNMDIKGAFFTRDL
jgi:WD40 repeat protein